MSGWECVIGTKCQQSPAGSIEIFNPASVVRRPWLLPQILLTSKTACICNQSQDGNLPISLGLQGVKNCLGIPPIYKFLAYLRCPTLHGQNVKEPLSLNQRTMENLLSHSSMRKEIPGNLIEECLVQLRCHFRWALVIEDIDIPDLESRILEQIKFLDIKSSVKMRNLLSYVKDLKGEHEEALQSLKDAEDLIQQEQANHRDLRSLVTWGNYAWVYYHMGRLAETQTYLDKVESTCNTFSSPFCYRMEHPEMDCEEGWALMKCGGQNYKRAKACFAKALRVQSENPEFSAGYAIAAYRQDFYYRNTMALEPLRQAVRLNPENAYIKVLFALKLQDVGREAEAENYIVEVLSSTISQTQTYIFRYVGKFYRRKGYVEKALQLFERALQATPSSAFLHHQIGLCYKAKVIQIKKAAHMRPRGHDNGNVDELIRLAMCEFEKTLQLKPTFEMAYVNLAEMYAEMGQFRKVEDNFQKALSLKYLDDHLKQEIYFRYGRLQQFHGKSENQAIIHYLKGLKIDVVSYSREKLLEALEKLANRWIYRDINIVEGTSLLGFIHKLKGEVREALLCYERALSLAANGSPVFEGWLTIANLMYS